MSSSANVSRSVSILVLTFSVFVLTIRADTPANCTYEDILGSWTFHVGPGGNDNSVNCTTFTPQSSYDVALKMYDNASDSEGQSGFWTLIYNQGFEVDINNRKWFAFSNYTVSNTTVTSHCHSTLNGWSHKFDGSDWACYFGIKKSSETGDKTEPKMDLSWADQAFQQPEAFIEAINKEQSSWKAAYYPQFENQTIRQMLRRAGGEQSAVISSSKITTLPHQGSPHSPPKHSLFATAGSLPTYFDWRNVSVNSNGTKFANYVSPVRNQEQCGSCYAFGSTAMLEARVRIYTDNQRQPIYSPQSIVSCSEYSQGCEGGFPYLIGKYGEDFQILEEECYPYIGNDTTTCSPVCTDRYMKTTDYHYLGGFYGAGNETNMMREIYENGPIAVSFEVYSDFIHYKSGVYVHTKSGLKGYNPWKITNHVVCIVGWGEDPSTSQKYWIVKNSWGTEWGINGYFWILRGVDEASIESMPVAFIPNFQE